MKFQTPNNLNPRTLQQWLEENICKLHQPQQCGRRSLENIGMILVKPKYTFARQRLSKELLTDKLETSWRTTTTTMQRSDDIDRVLEALGQTGLSVTNFLISLVSLDRYKNHPAVVHLMSHGPDLLITLRTFLVNKDEPSLESPRSVASEITMTETYAQKICDASAGENGSHFNVSHTSLNQLEEFSVNDLARQMEQSAPQFWRLLNVLLDARHRRRVLGEDEDQTMEPGESEDDEAYWSELGDAELEGATTIAGGLEKDAKRLATLRRNALRRALTKVVG